MQFRLKDLQQRQIILWGTNRHIYEFLYMFNDVVSCKGYISVNEGDGYQISLKKYEFNDLSNLYKEKLLIIICDLNIDSYILKLQENNFTDKVEYVSFRELFELLDPFNQEILSGRKIAVWGTGETERNFNLANKNNYDLEISLYIDNNPQKNNSYYQGRPVKLLAEIADISQYFIIIASIYYNDIKKQLDEYGLTEGKDYLSFSCFFSKPSKMLEKLVQSKEIPNFYCNRPYTFFYYAWFGAYSCCSTWVEYPIGNPASDSPEQCWNSIVAKLYRLSADTKTYCFCKKASCGRMHKLNIKDEVVQDYAIPKKITLGLDYTCNLCCTSCRDHVQVASGNQLKIREEFGERIIGTGWLEKTDNLELSGSGEALFSKIDREILFSNKSCKRESVSLLTNGILLNNDNLQKLKQHFKKIFINISIDAATENTYKSIRRGGDWKVLMENLERVGVMRQNNEIEYVEIRMVVQKRNYKEIPEFIQMGKKYHVDKVVFTKLLNWDMYSMEEYLEEAVLNTNGTIKPELEQILRENALNEEIAVITEFEHFLRRE